MAEPLVKPAAQRPASLEDLARWSYVYSYEVAAAHRQPTSRPIPGMRPSYDAENPTSPTPIYDSLYSEYRRLFRALPGDRTGEEELRFTGFASREPYAGAPRPEQYPPQQQTFHTYPGHAQGTPQFMPAQPNYPATGQGWVATGYLSPAVGRHRSMLSLPPGQH